MTPTSRPAFWGAVATLALCSACALMPVQRRHVVSMEFVAAPGEHYFVADIDSAAVYRTDELVVTVRYLSRQMLDAEYAQAMVGRVNLNPFTFGKRVDNDLGYVPDRFTVFELDVNNIGLPRVAIDPRQAVLHTDQGALLRPWGAEKGEAANTFEEYYRARVGPGGNDQEWYRQRMSIVQQSLYSGERDVFKGERNRGKLVFEVLPDDVQRVRLELPGVVVGYGANGLPDETLDLEFPFDVTVTVGPIVGQAGS